LTNLYFIFGTCNKALEKTALLFFLSIGFSRWQKNKCAVLALAFLVQM